MLSIKALAGNRKPSQVGWSCHWVIPVKVEQEPCIPKSGPFFNGVLGKWAVCPKRKRPVFHPSIFRCYVSFRECSPWPLVLEMIDWFMFELDVSTGSWNSDWWCQQVLVSYLLMCQCINVWCCICIYEGSSNLPSSCAAPELPPQWK